MMKPVKRIIYKFTFVLIILCLFINNVSEAASYYNEVHDAVEKLYDSKMSNYNYQVINAAQNMDDDQFEKWGDGMIELLKIALNNDDGYSTQAYLLATSKEEDVFKKLYYDNASKAMAGMLDSIYKMADLDNYLTTTTDINFLGWKVGEVTVNKEEQKRIKNFRKKLLKEFNLSEIGSMQTKAEQAKKVYDSALTIIDPAAYDTLGLFNKSVAEKKKFTKDEINKYYKTYGYNYGSTSAENYIKEKNEIEEAWAKTLNVKKDDLQEYANNIIKGLAANIQGATEEEVNQKDKKTQKEYKHPSIKVSDEEDPEKENSVMNIDETIKKADKFINTKDDNNPNNNIDTSDLSEFFNPIYNTALIVGIIVAVVVGSILGIKFMTGSVEQKADTKKLLIPYVAGCIAVFGAFAIWKLVVTIMAGL